MLQSFVLCGLRGGAPPTEVAGDGRELQVTLPVVTCSSRPSPSLGVCGAASKRPRLSSCASRHPHDEVVVDDFGVEVDIRDWEWPRFAARARAAKNCSSPASARLKRLQLVKKVLEDFALERRTAQEVLTAVVARLHWDHLMRPRACEDVDSVAIARGEHDRAYCDRPCDRAAPGYYYDRFCGHRPRPPGVPFEESVRGGVRDEDRMLPRPHARDCDYSGLVSEILELRSLYLGLASPPRERINSRSGTGFTGNGGVVDRRVPPSDGASTWWHDQAPPRWWKDDPAAATLAMEGAVRSRDSFDIERCLRSGCRSRLPHVVGQPTAVAELLFLRDAELHIDVEIRDCPWTHCERIWVTAPAIVVTVCLWIVVVASVSAAAKVGAVEQESPGVADSRVFLGCLAGANWVGIATFLFRWWSLQTKIRNPLCDLLLSEMQRGVEAENRRYECLRRDAYSGYTAQR